MNLPQCVVLGGGLVGGFIARQLANEGKFLVTLCDRSQQVLDYSADRAPLSTNCADLSDPDIVDHCVMEADIVIGAVPGYIGFGVLKAVIEANRNIVDISFFPEDPFELDDIARKRGVTAVVDCGVMPGFGGMLAARFAQQLDESESLSIMVGGLPEERNWPLEYRAPFSPIDVIEEYTRPARLVRDGQIVTLPPLSEPELIEFPGVGELEAFNTDGLRTLLDTLNMPQMCEKTLRYPGHAEKIRMLAHLGFFDAEPVEFDGQRAAPRDLTAELLIREWLLEEGMREFTAMRVAVAGQKDGRPRTISCDLLDRTDAEGNFSMARTTGYPAIIAARLLHAGKLEWQAGNDDAPGGAGIVCPEWIGRTGCFDVFRTELERVGIGLKFS